MTLFYVLDKQQNYPDEQGNIGGNIWIRYDYSRLP